MDLSIYFIFKLRTVHCCPLSAFNDAMSESLPKRVEENTKVKS